MTNDDQFYLFSDIFNSETPEKRVEKEQIRSTLELIAQHKKEGGPEKIAKKTNQNIQQSKWMEEDKKNYLKYYLSQFITRPYQCLSWQKWKPDQTLPRMSQYIKTKDMKQCKSYDERMKQENYEKKSLDILDYVCLAIQEFAINDGQILPMLTQLENLKNEKSKHMEILQFKIKTIKSVNSKLHNIMFSFVFS